MNVPKMLPPDLRQFSAAELRKLPSAERDAVLETQAVQADAHYRGDRQLTNFEAFGEGDLHGDASPTEAG